MWSCLGRVGVEATWKFIRNISGNCWCWQLSAVTVNGQIIAQFFKRGRTSCLHHGLQQNRVFERTLRNCSNVIQLFGSRASSQVVLLNDFWNCILADAYSSPNFWKTIILRKFFYLIPQIAWKWDTFLIISSFLVDTWNSDVWRHLKTRVRSRVDSIDGNLPMLFCSTYAILKLTPRLSLLVPIHLTSWYFRWWRFPIICLLPYFYRTPIGTVCQVPWLLNI